MDEEAVREEAVAAIQHTRDVLRYLAHGDDETVIEEAVGDAQAALDEVEDELDSGTRDP